MSNPASIDSGFAPTWGSDLGGSYGTTSGATFDPTPLDEATGGGHEPDARIEILSQPTNLAPVRGFVTAMAERTGFPCGIQHEIALAVDEALANVINHGYDKLPDGRIWLQVWRLNGGRAGLRIVIDDHGRQTDPDLIQPRKLDEIRPGGLGVHIIREIMDECRWERRGESGMRLTLVKYLPECTTGEPAAPADSTPT